MVGILMCCSSLQSVTLMTTHFQFSVYSDLAPFKTLEIQCLAIHHTVDVGISYKSVVSLGALADDKGTGGSGKNTNIVAGMRLRRYPGKVAVRSPAKASAR